MMARCRGRVLSRVPQEERTDQDHQGKAESKETESPIRTQLNRWGEETTERKPLARSRGNYPPPVRALAGVNLSTSRWRWWKARGRGRGRCCPGITALSGRLAQIHPRFAAIATASIFDPAPSLETSFRTLRLSVDSVISMSFSTSFMGYPAARNFNICSSSSVRSPWI